MYMWLLRVWLGIHNVMRVTKIEIDWLIDIYAGVMAEEAKKKKCAKYAHLDHFVPVTMETMGVFGPKARSFL